MRITFGLTAISPQQVLCSGVGKQQPFSFSMTSSTTPQVKTYLRSQFARPINRWNQVTKIGFSMNYFFATVRDSESFMMNLFAFRAFLTANNGSAFVVTIGLTPGATGGGTIQVADSVIDSIGAKYIGANCIADYSITGGKVTTTIT